MEAPCAVAVVGSRDATVEAKDFARDLASSLVRAGAVVVSGGAYGIDEAAHQGALDAGGRTWAVAATGCERCYPAPHAPLFEKIARGPGAVVWPFPPARSILPGSFAARNRVLVALSDAVVVVQAGRPSGALRAAEYAVVQRRPLWVVPAFPWALGFEGSRWLLEHGARPLTRAEDLMRSLDLSFSSTRDLTAEPMSLAGFRVDIEDPIQIQLLRSISSSPCHLDEIAFRAHITAHEATAALLTLALEAVVVEGPPGFFRRSEGSNR